MKDGLEYFFQFQLLRSKMNGAEEIIKMLRVCQDHFVKPRPEVTYYNKHEIRAEREVKEETSNGGTNTLSFILLSNTIAFLVMCWL